MNLNHLEPAKMGLKHATKTGPNQKTKHRGCVCVIYDWEVGSNHYANWQTVGFHSGY